MEASGRPLDEPRGERYGHRMPGPAKSDRMREEWPLDGRWRGCRRNQGEGEVEWWSAIGEVENDVLIPGRRVHREGAWLRRHEHSQVVGHLQG